MKKIAVLTGAGISAESGISTFRGADGLWEGHDIMEVASPEGFQKNPQLVLDFYNKRRQQLKVVNPNAAHFALKKLESTYQVDIITQNVDDLHERAGSSKVLHLHGELRKVRSTFDEALIYDWDGPCNLGDVCEKGYQLRPHIVWFGESVPLFDAAVGIISQADLIIIIGTSMQVYPAASLVGIAKQDAQVYYIDPDPRENWELSMRPHYTSIQERATKGVSQLVEKLLKGEA